MENCNVEIDSNKYNKPTQEYCVWEKEKLELITNYIDKKLEFSKKPTVIVLEIAHFMLPVEEENLDWATKNMIFANKLCENIIKKHKFKFKIIPTLLVNNLDDAQSDKSKKIIDKMLKNQKYINEKSLKVVSERNLKNRAFKALKKNKKLASSFINIDGKAYLKDDDYQHDLAAGFVNENGDIIPRCGLILTSYLDLLSKLAIQRLHKDKDIKMLFISFSEQFHEYKRVMLGVDIYSKMHEDIEIDPMVFHISYNKDQCQMSLKNCASNKWEDLLL